MSEHPPSIDAYIADCPAEVAAMLEQVRATIHTAVPGADETIRYGIPTLTVDGRPIIHFARWAAYLSVYPVPATDEELQGDIAPYRSGKSTVRFPLTKPIPYELIGRLARLLAAQRAGGTP
jgi:uncharacterized protein YdhG (YjbR/CyaY superfamily)